MNPSHLLFIQGERLSVDQVLDTHNLIYDVLLSISCTWLDVAEIELQDLVVKARM